MLCKTYGYNCYSVIIFLPNTKISFSFWSYVYNFNLVWLFQAYLISNYNSEWFIISYVFIEIIRKSQGMPRTE